MSSLVKGTVTDEARGLRKMGLFHYVSETKPVRLRLCSRFLRSEDPTRERVRQLIGEIKARPSGGDIQRLASEIKQILTAGTDDTWEEAILEARKAEAIGKRICILRRAKGISKKQLAARANISYDSVCRTEQCLTVPLKENLKGIAAVLGVDVSILTGVTPDKLRKKRKQALAQAAMCASPGEKVRILRTAMGISQEALAKKAHIADATIMLLERGKLSFTIKRTRDRLERALRVPSGFLSEKPQSVKDDMQKAGVAAASLVYGPGARVRVIREGLGLHRRQLSEISGVSIETIINVELGRIEVPEQKTIRNLAAALNVTPQFLMQEERVKKREKWDQTLQEAGEATTVGDRIRILRTGRGLTQEKLATEAGISESAVLRIENGTISPLQETLDALAKVLRVTAATIAPRDEAAERKKWNDALNAVPNIPGLGPRVRALREAKGWTGARLAEATGLQESYIFRIERKASVVPKNAIAMKLASALGVNVDLLTAEVPGKAEERLRGAFLAAENVNDTGTKLRLFREALRLSRNELARRAGITETAISDIETGRSKWMGDKNLNGLAVAMRIDVALLQPGTPKERERVWRDALNSLPGIGTIGARLKTLREARGWSASEMSRRVGLSQGSILNIESGESKEPRRDSLVRIAEALDIDDIELRHERASDVDMEKIRNEALVRILENGHDRGALISSLSEKYGMTPKAIGRIVAEYEGILNGDVEKLPDVWAKVVPVMKTRIFKTIVAIASKNEDAKYWRALCRITFDDKPFARATLIAMSDRGELTEFVKLPNADSFLATISLHYTPGNHGRLTKLFGKEDHGSLNGRPVNGNGGKNGSSAPAAKAVPPGSMLSALRDIENHFYANRFAFDDFSRVRKTPVGADFSDATLHGELIGLEVLGIVWPERLANGKIYRLAPSYVAATYETKVKIKGFLASLRAKSSRKVLEPFAPTVKNMLQTPASGTPSNGVIADRWEYTLNEAAGAESFGERIRLLRSAKGWSRSELARRSGISVGTVERYEERPVWPPRGRVTSLLSQVFEVSEDYLAAVPEKVTAKKREKAISLLVNIVTPGQRVRILREGATLSVRQLELRSGVSEGTIRDIEAGRRMPETVTIGKLAAALGVSDQVILYGTADGLEQIRAAAVKRISDERIMGTGKRVGVLRQAMGLSLAELARKSGLDPQTVSSLENDPGRRVSKRIVAQIAKGLGVPSSVLTGMTLDERMERDRELETDASRTTVMAERLKIWREGMGLTRLDLARVSGVPAGKIARMEKGITKMSDRVTVLRLAIALEIKSDMICRATDADVMDMRDELKSANGNGSLRHLASAEARAAREGIIGRRVRIWRAFQNLTRGRLAVLSGMNAGLIQRIETDAGYVPSNDELSRLAGALRTKKDMTALDIADISREARAGVIDKVYFDFPDKRVLIDHICRKYSVSQFVASHIVRENGFLSGVTLENAPNLWGTMALAERERLFAKLVSMIGAMGPEDAGKQRKFFGLLRDLARVDRSAAMAAISGLKDSGKLNGFSSVEGAGELMSALGIAPTPHASPKSAQAHESIKSEGMSIGYFLKELEKSFGGRVFNHAEIAPLASDPATGKLLGENTIRRKLLALKVLGVLFYDSTRGRLRYKFNPGYFNAAPAEKERVAAMLDDVPYSPTHLDMTPFVKPFRAAFPWAVKTDDDYQDIWEDAAGSSKAITTGDKVAALRKKAGLTQGELSNKSGVSQSIISRLESGDIKATAPDKLTQIAEVLGVRSSELKVKAPSITAAQWKAVLTAAKAEPRLGAAIVILRRAKGMSQDELSNVSGVYKRLLSRVEDGKTNSIDDENLSKIAKALDADKDVLIAKVPGKSRKASLENIDPAKAAAARAFVDEMAMRAYDAAKKNRILYIGIETTLTADDTGLSSLMSAVTALAERAGNIKIVRGKGRALATYVINAAGGETADLRNVLVLGHASTINDNAFDRLISTKTTEKACLIGLDRSSSVEKDDVSQENYERFLEALTVALRAWAAGKKLNLKGIEGLDVRETGPRQWIIVPKAERMPLGEPKIIYDAQARFIRSA